MTVKTWRSLALLALIGGLSVGLAFTLGSQRARPTLDSRVRTVASGLRCPICQGESVADSPSGLAASMRGVIRRQLQEGRTPHQVQQYFVARYGQWILLAPPAAGVGTIAWVGPPAILGAGAILLIFLLLRWRLGGRPAASEETFSATTERTRSSMPRQRPGLVQVGGLAAFAVLIAVVVSVAFPGTFRSSASTAPSTSSGRIGSRSLPADVRQAAAVVVAHPRHASAWVRLGSATLVEGQPAAARQAFRRALHLNSRLPSAYLGLGVLNVGHGRFRSGLGDLRQAYRLGARSNRLWLFEGLALARLPHGRQAAMGAWNRFLRQTGPGPLRSQVQQWVAQLRRGRPAP